MWTWLKDNPAIVSTLVASSIAMFVIGLIAAPIIVSMIPADYFTYRDRPDIRFSQQHPVVRMTLIIGKNLLGAILLLAGIAMLVLPGQGIMTIVVGLVLLDFPGKYRLQGWLIRKRVVHRPINWLRVKRGREPLELEPAKPA